MTAAVDDIIERFGFGKFGAALLFTSASLWIINGAEITLIAVLSSQLRCEWHLSSANTVLLSNTIFIGMAFGSLLLGWLSDKAGRKGVTIVLLIFLLYFGMLCAAAPSYTWFVILRIFSGIGTSVSMSGSLYLVEFLGKRYRAKAIILNSFFFALGNIYALLLAYLALPKYGWRLYVLFILIPVPLILLLVVWLPESIRFLQNTDNYDELMKTLTRISNMNNIPLSREINVRARLSSRRGSIRILRKFYSWTTLKSLLLTISANINLFGILFMSTEVFSITLGFGENLLNSNECTYIHGKDFLQTALVCVGAIVGAFTMCLLVDFMGRKTAIIICFGVSTIFFAVSALNLPRELMIALLFISRTFSDPLIHISWVFVAENHPAIIRGTVLGVMSFLSNISILVAPILIQWIFHLSKLSMSLSFVAITIIGISSTLLMPSEEKIKNIDVTRK